MKKQDEIKIVVDAILVVIEFAIERQKQRTDFDNQHLRDAASKEIANILSQLEE